MHVFWLRVKMRHWSYTVATMYRLSNLPCLMCKRALQHNATQCNTLQHTATHCNTLQHTATLCNTLQHTAAHWSTPLHYYRAADHRLPNLLGLLCKRALQHNTTHFDTLKHTATHCNTLQHTATHCNTLQHTAALCNTLKKKWCKASLVQHTRGPLAYNGTPKYTVRATPAANRKNVRGLQTTLHTKRARPNPIFLATCWSRLRDTFLAIIPKKLAHYPVQEMDHFSAVWHHVWLMLLLLLRKK